MKLFCVPYAGGSAMVYSSWNGVIDNSIEVVPIEISGRGTRFADPLIDNVEELVDQIYKKYKNSFIEDEYMIFGHSMGSLIVFYLADKIRHENIRLPSRLFFSGKESPDINKEDISYKLDDETFMQKIYNLGGTPKEIFENKECLQIFIPILKNDYKLVETCTYEREVQPFDCDITIFNGVDDILTKEDIYEWKKFTRKKFKVYNFEGGHFFINNHSKEITDIIYNQTI